MKYMLLTYLDEKAWLAMTPEQQKAEMESCAPHIEKMMAEKKIIAGAPLRETATATTLRYREGKVLMTDGPFAETREQLGGYTIIDANDLDDALSVAKGFLASSLGPNSIATIEVRPIVDYVGPVPTTPEVK